MGHAYIERLPRTRAWRAVVAEIAAGADARAVAEAVIKAARSVILPLPKDPGVVEAAWHLVRLPLAARDDFPAALRRYGLDPGDDPGLMDVIAATSDAIDAAVPAGRRTDLGEMAHTALAEILAAEFGDVAGGLFGEDPEAVRAAVAATATVKQFGRLAAAFFARLVRKVLDFFVSRALVEHVGAGRRFRVLRDQRAFTDALGRYAAEVAAGVDEYAGEWFKKWNYLSDGRIGRDQAARFLAHAAEKLDWAWTGGEAVANAWRFGCGGAGVPRGSGAGVELDLRPDGDPRPLGNVRLGIGAVRRQFLADCPPPFLDLLEVATYVYAADQAAGRGRPADLGANWRRRLAFRVPVRDPGRWADPAVAGPLADVLSFLSEDEYRFEFVPRRPDPRPGYFTFRDGPFDRPADEVVLFSGGLDSLAGAVEEAVAGRRHAVLVQHRSNPKLQPRHERLVRALGEKARAAGGLVTHVPVVVNKDEGLTAETTQRSRSFLFAALAAAVGAMVGRDRVRFYENGVVGLNLPLSPAVVGARATRTTHPRTLAGFARVLTAVAGRRVAVDGPFQWDTRADVIRRLADAGCADLIRWTTSCGATRGMTTAHPHCGVCSQCVGRRFAVLAAGQGDHDPADEYRVEVLTGDRADSDPRLVLAAFLDAAERVERAAGPTAFFALFGEAARILRATGEPAGAAAGRVYQLYRRHAAEVSGVLDDAGRQYIGQLRRGELPEGCTLRLVFDTGPADLPDPLVAVGEAVSPPPSPRPVPKRSRRAGKIERLTAEMIAHLRAARDHAVVTRDLGGVAALLPPPTKKQLGLRAGLSKADVTRCFQDPTARELNLYWQTAFDLDRVLNFGGPVSAPA